MPKGEMNVGEIRNLIRQHNKLQTIKMLIVNQEQF